MTTRREQLIYFSVALLMFLLFRHLLGPLLGLSGLMLTLASYAVAILIATGYLYKTLLRPSRGADDKEAQCNEAQ